MKKLTTLSLSVVAAGLLFITGCKENEKTTDTITTPNADAIVVDNARVEGPVDVQTDAVPVGVQTSFKTNNAKADKVTWKKYSANTNEDDVRLLPNNDYYYVMYYNDGADYTTWYDTTGTMVKTSMRVKGPKELPDAVNMVINKEFPGYVIDEIDKENDKDIDVYEIEMNKGDSKAKIKITPDGKIVKRKVD